MLEQQVRRMLADPQVRSADPQLHRSVARRALADDERAGRQPLPRLRRQPARRLRARNRAVLRRASSRRIAASSICSTADYTFVNERLAKHYGIPEHLRPAVPPRDAAGGARHAARPARQGRAADGDVERGAHVAGDARQVVPATFLGVEPPHPPPDVSTRR